MLFWFLVITRSLHNFISPLSGDRVSSEQHVRARHPGRDRQAEGHRGRLWQQQLGRAGAGGLGGHRQDTPHQGSDDLHPG